MPVIERNMIERAAPVIMDGIYLLSLLLSLLGFRLVPFPAIPYLMVPSCIALFWTYRQVREYGIGSGGAPLLEQLGLAVPRFIQWAFLWAGVLLYFLFPFYIGVLMAMSFDPSFGDPARWPAWLKLVSAVVLLCFVIFTWFCLASDRDEKKSMPGERSRIYLRYVLPLAALLLGESAASLADLIRVALKDSGTDALFAVTVFIPLRIVLMRSVGATRLVIASFIVTGAVSVALMMLR